jgi:hypothetical protein
MRLFLPYAFIEALAAWHGGQDTAEYSVGSCFRTTAFPFGEWDVSELEYTDDDVAGYYATLPDGYAESLATTAEQIVAHADTPEMQWTAEDACEECDSERYYEAAVSFLSLLDA